VEEFAEAAVLDAFDEGQVGGEEAEDLRGHEDAAGGAGGLQDGVTFRAVEGHGFLDEHVLAVAKGFEGDGGVEGRGEADIDGVEAGIAGTFEGVEVLAGAGEVEGLAAAAEVAADGGEVAVEGLLIEGGDGRDFDIRQLNVTLEVGEAHESQSDETDAHTAPS
jgi:hypothetical protein